MHSDVLFILFYTVKNENFLLRSVYDIDIDVEGLNIQVAAKWHEGGGAQPRIPHFNHWKRRWQDVHV